MNKITKKLKTVGLLLLFLTWLFPAAVSAQEAAGSIRVVELTTVDQEPVQGVELTLYQIADPDPSAAGEYILSEDFADCGVDLGLIRNKEKYASMIQKLDAYIEKAVPHRTSKQVTDQTGTADFQGLSEGLFFIKQTNQAKDFEKLGYSFSTESYMIEIPSMDENGVPTREIVCQPKVTVQYPEDKKTEIVVYKVWKDDNDSSKTRPNEIKVGLYGNGVLKETVALTVNKNWTHQWKEMDKSVKWSVKELAVPSGYRTSVTNEENVFTITNVLEPKNENRNENGNGNVKTGDNSDAGRLLILCVVSFGVMVIILVSRMRKRA